MEKRRNEPSVKTKVIFLGEAAVGKSCLISCIRKSTVPAVHQPTIGVDFFSQCYKGKYGTYKMQYWDTAGQERFRSIIPSYIRNTDIGVLVADASSMASMESLSSWLQTFRNYASAEAKVLIALNKADLCSKDDLELQRRLKKEQFNVPVFLTSAKFGDGINEVIDEMVNITDRQHSGTNFYMPDFATRHEIPINIESSKTSLSRRLCCSN